MKPPVFLFNPDNDLALANGNENYIPSRQAGRMSEDLALLPAWYAPQGACVLMPDSGFHELAEKEYGGLLSGVCMIKKSQIAGSTRVMPWGWNSMLVRQLRLSGISPEILPSKESMEIIRQLSHRSYSVFLLKEMLVSEFFCGSSVCLDSQKDVKSFVEKNGDCLLKAPWSGSGKGLFWCKGEYTYPAERWSKKVIEKQGCVIGELLYDKVEDFAMEFYSDGSGKASFAGYSFFMTNERGAYKGNILATDKYIEDYLSTYIGTSIFSGLKEILEQRLSASVGTSYRGYLGVDMMICRFTDMPVYRIHPCVEVNLRMNMGMVARLFYDRYLSPGTYGLFFVDYFADNADLQKNHKTKCETYPLLIKDGKISSGYLSLTPIGEKTHYRAGVWVK